MKRANFKLSDRTAAILKGLTDDLDMPQVDVLGIGLRLARRAVEAQKRGQKLAIISSDGGVIEIEGEWSTVHRLPA